MNTLRLRFGLLLFMAAAVWQAAAAVEQLTTVAIVDTGRVYTTFFKESQAVRDWEQLKLNTQKELNTMYADINKLNADRLDAIKQNNAAESLRLEQEITKRTQFYNDYKKVKQQQITDTGKALSQSDAFMSEIAAAIKYVAESEGYTVVMDTANSSLRFWSPEVDITDKVLDQLKKTTGR